MCTERKGIGKYVLACFLFATLGSVYDFFQQLSTKHNVLCPLKKRFPETLLLRTQNVCLIGKNLDNKRFWSYIFYTSLPIN